MKKRIDIIVVVMLLITAVLSGCNRKIRYGGEDVLGNTAADAVRGYYELMDEEEITLISLDHCEVVDEADIRESDSAWIETISENYAYCFVQTADTVLCEEDSSIGAKGETVKRNYYYALIMETEESEWQIDDIGYPPFSVD